MNKNLIFDHFRHMSTQKPTGGRSYEIVLWVLNSSHSALQTLLREFFSIPAMRVAG